MAYLIDSDIVIDLLGDDPVTLRLLDRLSDAGLTISHMPEMCDWSALCETLCFPGVAAFYRCTYMGGFATMKECVPMPSSTARTSIQVSKA